MFCVTSNPGFKSLQFITCLYIGFFHLVINSHAALTGSEGKVRRTVMSCQMEFVTPLSVPSKIFRVKFIRMMRQHGHCSTVLRNWSCWCLYFVTNFGQGCSRVIQCFGVLCGEVERVMTRCTSRHHIQVFTTLIVMCVLLLILFVEHAFPDQEQAKTSGHYDCVPRNNVYIAICCCEIPNGQAEWKIMSRNI